MRASEFEFRHRSWFILLIFLLAFGCYSFEHVNAVEWLVSLMGRGGPAGRAVPAAPEAHIIFGLGAMIIGLGALIRTWGTAYLNTEVVRDPVVRADRVVADGPYRYVRNPLYIGSLLLAVGLAPMAPPIGCVLLIVGMEFFFLRLIGGEEAFLLEKQGDAYRTYLEHVPRLRPALRPRLPAGGIEPRWGQAWVGEMGMWAAFIGTAYFALTFDIKVFDIVLVAGFFVSRVVRPRLKRRTEHGAE